MLTIFLDVQNEIREITQQLEVMRRKIERFKSTDNIEDKDSHVRAIAGCLHSIYSGMGKIYRFSSVISIAPSLPAMPGTFNCCAARNILPRG